MISGVSVNFDQDSKSLLVSIIPKDVKDKLTSNSITRMVKTKFPQHILFEESVKELVKEFQGLSSENDEAIEAIVGEAKDFDVEFKISEDELTAHAKLTAARGGEPATVAEVLRAAKRKNILRGVSKKRAKLLVEKANDGEPGAVHEDLIAKGLPARHGKGSKKIPLFENLTERFSKPIEISDGKVDMRDFGEIFSVDPGTPVLKFVAPTNGRNGYTVANKPILANAGKWSNKQCGPGTVFSDEDENLIISEREGIPKFDNGLVTVDDVYMSPGCNVKTGNINYEGDVVIIGDVTEGMSVDVKGDVTVHGFVESATIRATGNITISQGATGKMDEDLSKSTTSITANGDIYVEQGRGLMLKCLGKITVGKQLAFSNLDCSGNVIAGNEKKPTGNIYASEIRTLSKIRVGKLGAVSGSKLIVDYGSGKTKLLEKTKQLEKMKLQINESLIQHEKTLDQVANKKLSDKLQQKVKQIRKLYQQQKRSLKVIEIKLERNTKRLEEFDSRIGIETYQKLFHGVQIKFDKYLWEASDDLSRSKVYFKNRKWHREPM